MPLLGIHCYVIAQLGKTATVQPYRPNYEPMDIHLVHAAVEYDCPYSGKTYVLLIRNSLYVSIMTHNLIPPFIMREAGITVKDVAKIHVENPTNLDLAVVFENMNFKVSLSLRRTLSYFESSKSTRGTMLDCDEIYLLTPTRWNLHTTVYEENEAIMIDWKRDIVEPKYRNQIILKDVDSDDEGDIGAVICEV